ncbi:Sterol O-acyltransferase 2 (Sterol-ester synthase 2) [Coemansia sp. RSA 1365]|nr:Sterol O-acyltransferase 2 (Sterol-ester synthase 2) [Coemansia sp. RSA 1365]
MFVTQVADEPPSSRNSPRLRPQFTRNEIEERLTSGSSPPVFTPSLRRSLRKDRENTIPDTLDNNTSTSPSKQDDKQKGQIFFLPRTSILDYTELMYQGSDRIRGLMTCFWTIIGAYLVSLLLSHYEKNGVFLSRGLASLIFSRGTDLILSDLALVLSTAFVVPFVRILWIGRWQPRFMDPRHTRAMVLQAVVEVVWLVFWYSWQGTRGWPWSQRCFFALHTVVNWMKVHSYLSTNRHLACSLRTRDELVHQISRKIKDDKQTQERIQALDAELSPYTARFPETQTLANYAMFQLCPVLVYEVEYPRTTHIRWGYVAEKMAGTVGIFAVFYIIVAHLMIPHLERMPESGVLLTTVHLMGPMATCWLLFFFITFDSIANGFAELTRFADRRFYDDWWNVRGLDEFSRKWNRPVHLFLARHIYMPVREYWKSSDVLGKSQGKERKNNDKGGNIVRRMLKTMPASTVAMAATFLFSSVLHEVTVVVACHRWNYGMFFFSQMMQIPLIPLANHIPWFKDQQALRNWAFWLSMVFFQPLLLCLYTYSAFAPKEGGVYSSTFNVTDFDSCCA